MAGRMVVVSAETFDRMLTVIEAAQAVATMTGSRRDDAWLALDAALAAHDAWLALDAALAALDGEKPQSIRELVDRGKP